MPQVAVVLVLLQIVVQEQMPQIQEPLVVMVVSV
jgi:hypothetical protein